MKKLFFSALLSIAFCVVSSASVRTPDTLRVLSIANSYGEDAVEQNLHDIALADGHVIIIGNMYIGGCFLEKHWMNAERDSAAYSYRKVGVDGKLVKRPSTSLDYALRDEKWDVVIFHQSSGLSGKVESYEPWLTKLLKYTRERVPRRCKMMLNQTWAYAIGSTNPNFPEYGFSQERMYKELTEAYSAEAKKHRMPMIPSGTAVQNSRHTFNRENVTRDGFHMQWWFGRYLVACTYYEALYGQSVVGNSYVPKNLSRRRIDIAQKCAHAACEHPMGVTRVDFDNPFDTSDGNWKPDYINTDPSKIPAYTLPDALTMQDGRKVTTPEQWYGERRGELLELFDTEMYGKAPRAIQPLVEVLEEDTPALDGLALRTQVKLSFSTNKFVVVLMYRPKGAEGPVPAFMGINFDGNATICDDPGILRPGEQRAKRYGIYVEQPRGRWASRWPLKEILSRGYALVTFHCYDADPDYDDGFRNGLTPLIYEEGQKYPKDDQWGTISTWAWTMSRVLDYLESEETVDASRVAAIGHSRLGKAALLASVRDQRFAMAISNDSGCGGAALSRRRYGETLKFITGNFPHWFCTNFLKYVDNEDALPFDQHEFLALMAPRPLYVASAEDDSWTDPVGELLAYQEARRVYDFLGLDAGLTGYHLREGEHELTYEDWAHYLDFADKHLKH